MFTKSAPKNWVAPHWTALHYILSQDPNSMLSKFLMTQIKCKTNKDWCVHVFSDLKELEIDEDIKRIKSRKKLDLKNILYKEIKRTEDLNNQKENRSKVCHIKHTSFEMEKYLSPGNIKKRKKKKHKKYSNLGKMSKTSRGGVYIFLGGVDHIPLFWGECV